MTLAFAAIGFADDYAKVKKQTTAGVSGRVRLLIGFLVAGSRGYWAAINHPEALQYELAFPVFKELLLNLSFLFVPFAMVVIVGAANAVNLTDGLDGLAIMPVMIAAGTFGNHRLFRWSRRLFRGAGHPLYPRLGRDSGLLRRADRGGPGGSLVQRAAGGRVHGRYRIAALGGALGPSLLRPSMRSCWPSSAAFSWLRR